MIVSLTSVPIASASSNSYTFKKLYCKRLEAKVDKYCQDKFAACPCVGILSDGVSALLKNPNTAISCEIETNGIDTLELTAELDDGESSTMEKFQLAIEGNQCLSSYTEQQSSNSFESSTTAKLSAESLDNTIKDKCFTKFARFCKHISH